MRSEATTFRSSFAPRFAVPPLTRSLLLATLVADAIDASSLIEVKEPSPKSPKRSMKSPKALKKVVRKTIAKKKKKRPTEVKAEEKEEVEEEVEEVKLKEEKVVPEGEKLRALILFLRNSNLRAPRYARRSPEKVQTTHSQAEEEQNRRTRT